MRGAPRVRARLGDNPLTIFQQRWRKDDEALRNSLLDGLDDLHADGLLTKATIPEPGELMGPPPRVVLLVCPSCGLGVAESRVRDGYTERLECPKCHQWIKQETYLPKYARRGYPFR